MRVELLLLLLQFSFLGLLSMADRPSRFALRLCDPLVLGMMFFEVAESEWRWLG